MWHDLASVNLRVKQYNPNVLLTVTEDSQVQVWTEYTNPKGLGFNVVFSLVVHSPSVSWLHNFSKTDCSTSKYDKSRLFEVREGMPHSVYGMLSKTPPPVDWFVVSEAHRLSVFQCEGLGSYPYTAVTITPCFQSDHFWPEYAARWRPHHGFLVAVREDQDLLLFGQDCMEDFVRWRKAFGEDSVGTLTSVAGSHQAAILSIESHIQEPVFASLDRDGTVRIWSTSTGVRQDKRAVDCIRHWGALEECKGTAIKWTPTFALLLVGTESALRVYKWKSDFLSHLKLPSMHWGIAAEWAAPGPLKHLYVSKLSVDEIGEFNCLVAGLYDGGYCLWNLLWNGESFAVEVTAT
jgi:WD40 repeat protein